MARAIRKQAVEVRDGHALELLKAPFAVSLFRAYAENCAPVSGFLRCYPSSSSADVSGVGGTDDLLALLALLAPAVSFVVVVVVYEALSAAAGRQWWRGTQMLLLLWCFFCF